MIFNTGNNNVYSGYGVLILIFVCTSFGSCQELIKSNDGSKKEVITKTCQIFPISDSLDKPDGINECLSNLELIIHTKDFNRLLHLVDSDVVVSYGEALYGKDEFIKYWKDSINQAKLWNTLNRILVLGGGVEEYESQESFVLPYTQINRFYKGVDHDRYGLAVITSPQTFLYDETLNRVIDTLDYDIIEFMDGHNPKSTQIKTVCSNKEGWVLDEDFYECLDYSLILVRDKSKGWRIKVFSAG